MDLRTELLREHSAANNRRLVQYIGASPQRLAALVNITCGEPSRPAQLAAGVLGWVGEAHPPMLLPHLPRLLATLSLPKHHPAVRRGIWRALQFVAIPESLLAETFDHCLCFLQSTEPVATQVYALDVAATIAGRYPELAAELLALLTPLLPSAQPAMCSRANRLLPALQKLVNTGH